METAKMDLTVDGVELQVRLVRKKVKNINARLRGTVLHVSAPAHVSRTQLDRVVRRLASRLLRRSRAAEVNALKPAADIAGLVAARFPEPPEVAEVRFVATQSRSWGSYSARTKIVRLNMALRQFPRWVLEAIIAHELAHSFFLDHSPEFWSLLRDVCPQTDRARGFLDAVSWLAERWDDLPPVERSLLTGREAD